MGSYLKIYCWRRPSCCWHQGWCSQQSPSPRVLSPWYWLCFPLRHLPQIKMCLCHGFVICSPLDKHVSCHSPIGSSWQRTWISLGLQYIFVERMWVKNLMQSMLSIKVATTTVICNTFIVWNVINVGMAPHSTSATRCLFLKPLYFSQTTCPSPSRPWRENANFFLQETFLDSSWISFISGFPWTPREGLAQNRSH